MASDKPGLVEELKRRHVWRVAVAYVVAGWLLIQVATQVFPFFKIPDWAVRLVVLVIVLGFPVAVVLAWVYEITPEGVRRTVPAGSPDARPAHEARQVGRRLNSVIITVLVVAVALLGWRLLVLRHAPLATQTATAASPHTSAVATAGAHAEANTPPTMPVTAEKIPAKSIAVLPFVNEGGDKD
ncbi:MAG: hypothetical protein ACREPU_01065 [Rhodanobacteraceae bacterium]